MQNSYDVIVIGGGAAGMTAAGFVAQSGLSVAVFDKNSRPARKVVITGKGRCNVTNDCSNEEFLSAVRSNGRFMYSSINAFDCRDVMEHFESLGVPLKTERGQRVFPQSDRSLDIVDALERFLRQSGGRYINQKVRAIVCNNGEVKGVELENGTTVSARAVIVATGGMSYPKTGSDGDGYRFAKQCGHTIVAPRPSLVPIETVESSPQELQGLSLKNVTLTVTDKNGRDIFSETGEMIFTHFGISGPLVLSASAHIKEDTPRSYSLKIDLKPGLNEEMLDRRLLRDFDKYKNKDLINALFDLLPRSIVGEVVAQSGIDARTKINQITVAMRQSLLKAIKSLSFTYKRLRPIEEAIVTAGGVSVREIDPKTMQSRLVKGLFFAGEVLDLDAYTGGFNLQIAFSTAYAAANGAKKFLCEGETI